ncbi:hypothetical protein BDV10DRAFT_172626 [Aspergillus recurvatus]
MLFFIPELLEAILLQTDFRTILLAQRVCRFPKPLIRGYHCLQDAIWFRPPHKEGLKQPDTRTKAQPAPGRTHLAGRGSFPIPAGTTSKRLDTGRSKLETYAHNSAPLEVYHNSWIKKRGGN